MMHLCLNLARRPDRRLRSWNEFRREKIEVARLVAPDAVGCGGSRAYRNAGARACASAHRLAWRRARKGKADKLLVFEDDVVLCRDFAHRLQVVWSVIPNDWMILYLGCVFQSPPKILTPGLLKVTGATWDMHGYAIRRPLWDIVSRELSGISCRSRIIDPEGDSNFANKSESWWALDPKERGRRRWDTACDVVLADYHTQFPAYAVWPPMAWQARGLSNNENTVRGNYLEDGTQWAMREAIRHLPEVGNNRSAD